MGDRQHSACLWTANNWPTVLSLQIWHHTFYNVLHIAPEQHPVMITEPPLNSKHVKSRTTQVNGAWGQVRQEGRLLFCPYLRVPCLWRHAGPSYHDGVGGGLMEFKGRSLSLSAPIRAQMAESSLGCNGARYSGCKKLPPPHPHQRSPPKAQLLL